MQTLTRNQPRDANHLYNAALDCLKIGDRVAAMPLLEQTCLANPKHSRAYANRGVLLFNLNEFVKSIECYDKAIEYEPAAQYYINKGSALMELNQWQHAEECFREAIARDPNFEVGWNNLGRLLLRHDHLSQAELYLRKAIEIKPDYAKAHIALAFICLEQKRFEEGWKEYEWRRREFPGRPLPHDWDGRKLQDDEAIILLGEQGLGDILQFCRYAPLFKHRFGGRVYLEVPSTLRLLMTTLDGVDGIIESGEDLPKDAKYYSMLLSMPLAFGHFDERQFPAYPSYLRATDYRYEFFNPFFADLPPGMKVGFCWAGGGKEPSIDRHRSTKLTDWEPLANVGGVVWVSLQQGEPAKQLQTERIRMTILNIIGECQNMADTAALIMHCDLVITVDTAIAHLSAALGKPTWVLSRRDACWRWLQDRRDSPWYPTVRHYRQHKFNDWAGLMPEVADDLRKLVKEYKQRKP